MPNIDPATQRRRIVRLLIVASIVLLMVGGIYALYRVNRSQQGAMSDEQRIALAQEAYEAKDYEQVIRLLEDPDRQEAIHASAAKDPDLLQMYITAREAEPLSNDGHLARLIGPLRELIRLRPDDLEVKHKLLDTLLTIKRSDEALALAEELTKQYPEDAASFRKLGQVQAQKRQPDQAIASLNRSLELDPLQVPAYFDLLKLLTEYNKPLTEAAAMSDRVLAEHPQDPRAMMIRALFFETQGDGVQSRTLLKEASTVAPPDDAIITPLTQWLDRTGMITDATRYLLQYAPKGIDSPASRMAIYRAFESGDHQAIIDRLQSSDADEANSDLIGMWANALIQVGQVDEAKKHIQRLKDRQGAIAKTWAKLLSIELAGDTTPGQTIDLLVEVLESKDKSELTEFARRHPYFMQQLGRAYLQAMEPEAAYAAFSIAVSNSSTWAKPSQALAETLLKLNQPVAALGNAQQAMQRDNSPESIKWTILAMTQAARQNNEITAEQVLRLADQLTANSEEAQAVLPSVVDLLVKEQRLDEARQRIREALTSGEAIGQLCLETLAEVSNLHQLGLEDDLIKAIESRFGSTPRTAMIGAQALAATAGVDAGEQYLLKAAPTPLDYAWQTAVAEYLKRQGSDRAGSYLIDMAEQYPDDLALQIAAMQVNQPAGHRDFFNRAIQRVRDRAGQSTIHWRLQQARLDMQTPDDEKALKQTAAMLRGAEGFTPVHLELRLALALCYLLLDENEAAAQVADQAKAIAPNHPQALLLHGKALHRIGRYQASAMDLMPLARNPNVSPDIRYQACLMLYEQGDRATVKQTLETMWAKNLAANPALTLLARIYASEGDLVKADRVCSVLLSDPDIEAFRFVTSYYRQTNRPELAEQALAAARSAELSEVDQLALRSQDAADRGVSDKALEMIEEAAALDPSNPKRWQEAVQLALSLAKPDDAVRLAKRGVAALGEHEGLSGLVQHADLVKQISGDRELIPLTVAIANADTFAPQAIAALKLTQNTSSPERAAIELAKLAAANPGYKHLTELASDRLLRSGEDKEAFELSNTAMARFPDSAAVARVATLSAYRLEQWAILLSAADAWASRNPLDRPRADLMRAAALNQLKRFSTSVETLRPYLQVHTSLTDANNLFFELLTRAMVNSGDAAGAWAILRVDLATNPEAHAITLKRISDDLVPAEAVKTWLRNLTELTSADPDYVSISSAAFMAGQRLNDNSLIALADQYITQLLDQPGPHPLDAKYAKGQIAHRMGNLDVAEACYRVVLKSAPDQPLVMNNLAVILTERGGGSLPEAEQLAQRAIELSPKDPNLLDTLAIVQMRRARFEDALKTIDKAIRMDGGNPAWRMTQADIFEANGQKERADQIRERFKPQQN